MMITNNKEYSPEVRGLSLMKCSSKIHHNLRCFFLEYENCVTFHIPKSWQSLKYFTGTFHQAQASLFLKSEFLYDYILK